MMRVEIGGAARFRKSARRFLVGRDQQNIDDALYLEAMLSILWPLAFQPDGQFAPVHHNKLASRGRSLMALIGSDKDVRELQAHALDHLALLGAIARLPRGYVLPAPLRWVQLEGREAWALVGGVPVRLLPADVRETLSYNHLLRMTERNPESLSLTLPVQHLASWIGLPQVPLERWTASIIERLSAEADAVTAQAIADHEVYLPGIASSPYQKGRWQSSDKLRPLDICLARLVSPFRSWQWGLLELDRRRTYRYSTLHPAEIDTRRLMYGFDARADQATSVTIAAGGSGNSILSLGSELPDAERRFLLAIGRVTSPSPDHYYPRVWVFPTRYESDVQRMLTNLHIEIR